MPEIEQLTDIILEKLNSIFVVINKNGAIDFVSPSVKKILGFEPAILTGEGWWYYTRNNREEREKAKSLAFSMLKNSFEENLSFENILKTSAGGNKWIAWNYSQGPNGSLIGVGHDITARKNTEQQLELKNKELQSKNTEIIDSIVYATRIQKAILPDIKAIKRSFTEAFVLYKPKDLVSGDFYWYYEKNNKVFIAAIDCTGHGVPGALMSVIANSILKEIVIKSEIEEPAEILNALDREICKALTKEGDETPNDGMDIAFCVFDKDQNSLEFSGAFRPLFMIRNGEIIEYKANRYPIGFYSDVEKDFLSVRITIREGDSFYIFSDGYIDQFGGEQGKKLNKTRFKELLLMIQGMSLEEQEAFLEYSLLNWQQEEEQTDDILVIGIKF